MENINCPKCGTLFDPYSKHGPKRFCSRKCANSRGPRTEEFKKKVSEKLIGWKHLNRRSPAPKPKKTQKTVSAKETRICVCGTRFLAYKKSVKKFCTRSCFVDSYCSKRETRCCVLCNASFEVLKTNAKRYCSLSCYWNSPCVRKKKNRKFPTENRYGGRGKSGVYNGVYCASTYELVWVVYNMDHNIEFKRFDGFLTDGVITYIPDFLIDEKHIVEIKGYHTSDVDRKTSLAIALGYTIDVLYKDDLQKHFDWVCSKYSVPKTRVFDLYEDKDTSYIHKYTCYSCGKEIKTHKKKKRQFKRTFCDRSCFDKRNNSKTEN